MVFGGTEGSSWTKAVKAPPEGTRRVSLLPETGVEEAGAAAGGLAAEPATGAAAGVLLAGAVAAFPAPVSLAAPAAGAGAPVCAQAAPESSTATIIRSRLITAPLWPPSGTGG